MEFTGERFMPTEQGKIRIEHFHRYALTKEVVKDKAVLDVASGEGYGSYFIAEFAKSVTGVDVSSEAVAHAEKKYQRKNLSYRVGNVTDLDFDDDSFDVVVSFETIEHLAEQSEMLKELRRVLKPSGILVLSSPNRPVYSNHGEFVNEYHVKELDFKELDDLLATCFEQVDYYGQGVQMGSLLHPVSKGMKKAEIWFDDGETLSEEVTDFPEPEYFIAVCAAQAVTLPSLNVSSLFPQALDLVKHYVGFADWAKRLDVELEQRNQLVVELQNEVEEKNNHIVLLDTENAEERAKLQVAVSEAKANEQAVIALKGGVEAKDKLLSGYGEVVKNKDALISQQESLLQERSQENKQYQSFIQELNDAVSVKTEQLERREAQYNSLSEKFHSVEKASLHLEELNGTLTNKVSKMETDQADLQNILAEREDHIRILCEEKDARDYRINDLEQTLAERDSHIAILKRDIQIRDQRIEHLLAQSLELLNIKSSWSWRITRPLRELKAWVFSPVRQFKRYVKALLRFLKKRYQALPISQARKERHRRFLARYFSKVLKASDTNFPRQVVSADRTKMIVRSVAQEKKVVEVAAQGADIIVPSSDKPVVSVIIPIYGQIDYTLQCLRSIVRCPAKVPFEVIVVDDASPDNSVEVLSQVKGITLLQAAKNQGFIRTCNLGASQAKGEYVYFLNNDTEVTPGWLDELFNTFDAFPGTGLVGSKLVYGDGRLQEAGGIIWKDGSAWNFGRLGDPDDPEYNYVRETDYVSGASIMLPKTLFDEVGGFDEHYLPAYCEDSDLALKVREKGYRVLYQPFSTIVHYEGITSGTDTSSGVKAYQVENSKKLFKRWEHFLSAYQANGEDVARAKDRASDKRVLVLDHCTVTPQNDAGSLTIFNTMILFREMGFQVSFIPEDNFLYIEGDTERLQRAGIEVIHAPKVVSVEQHLQEHGERYDLVFLVRPIVVDRHLDTVRKYCPQAKTIFHTTDLHFLRMEREAEQTQNDELKAAAAEMKERELRAIRETDAPIVHSTAELDLLQELLPEKKIHLFPLILDIYGTEVDFSARKDIAFVGGYQHTPNVDSVKFFSEEVFPLIQNELPDVKFYAAGSNPTAEVSALASESIKVTGFIDDLNSFLDQIRVSVAPIRYGAGIKGKLGTAMSVGLPSVATSIAAEGMNLTDGENVLIANTPQEFAQAVVKLYTDEGLWTRLAQKGLQFSYDQYGPVVSYVRLAGIAEYLGVKVPKVKPRTLQLYSNAGQRNHTASSMLNFETETAEERALELLSLEEENSLGLWSVRPEFDWEVTQINDIPVLSDRVTAPDSAVVDGIIKPISTVWEKEAFIEVYQKEVVKDLQRYARSLLNKADNKGFFVRGYCSSCEDNRPFWVDYEFGGFEIDGQKQPNWRERLECPVCRLNNRQRLIASIVKREIEEKDFLDIYFMEQVTPIYEWAKKKFGDLNIQGSEYLGFDLKGGEVVNGIRHEDVEALSFESASLDMIVSNDVFEHVPHPAIAFKECARVLRKGGTMWASIPFHPNNEKSVERAVLVEGKLVELLPAQYHGNPIDPKGSIVFTDFGWDILDMMKEAGFSDACVEIYMDAQAGHIGEGQIMFKATV